MKKVLYSVIDLRKKEDNKISGIGYLIDNNLITAVVPTRKGAKPYVRIFEDVTPTMRSLSQGEYKGYFYEHQTIDIEDKSGRITNREFVREYLIWYKEIE